MAAGRMALPREETPPVEEQIRARAYEIYLQRGDEPGSDIEDWLKAEREIAGDGEVERAW